MSAVNPPPSHPSQKVLDPDQLLPRREASRAGGETLVHCHGCFDIVHPGHVRHLEHARELGDRLLVSVTADRFVSKGYARPMFGQEMRAANLAALSCVDWVVINHAPTASGLLEQVKPDVYVKGAEYEDNNDPRFLAERNAVESAGGRVVFTSADVVFSSTALISAMRQSRLQPHYAGPIQLASATARLDPSDDISLATIRRVVEGMRGKQVAIIGESITDTYVDCAWPELSGEAPILSLRPKERVHFDGGAAILALHAANAGARPHLITPLPGDEHGLAMQDRLESAGVVVLPVDCPAGLPRKERYLVGREKLAKLDYAAPIELDQRTREKLVSTAKEIGDSVDAVAVVDFGHSMLGPKLTGDLFDVLRPRVEMLVGDVSGPRVTLEHMKQADWLMPSERELRSAISSATGSLPAVVANLMQRTDAKQIAVTMADQGVIMFKQQPVTQALDGQPTRLTSMHIPAFNCAPMDTLGCGDAMLTFTTLAQLAGATAGTAIYIGSLAAAICASKLGNHPCRPGELLMLAEQLTDQSIARPAIAPAHRPSTADGPLIQTAK